MTGAILIGAATLVAVVLTLSWSVLRVDFVDGEQWRSALSGAATITALAAAGVLAMWWRRQLEASTLWWALAMTAIGVSCAVELSAVLVGGSGGIFEGLAFAAAAAAVIFTMRAVASPRIDLEVTALRVAGPVIAGVALAASLWFVAPADLLTAVAWGVVAAIALAFGLRRRDQLAGWFGVGALGVLNHSLAAYQAAPDAVVAVGTGVILELSLVAMLLGVVHHIEQSHAGLERKLRAAHASLDLMKKARRARLHETEQRLHEARSALAAIDLASQLVPEDAGGFPLRQTLQTEVAMLRRLVTPSPTESREFRIADALIGAVSVERLYGVEVTVRVPSHLTAVGDLPATAEVVQCLLENARIHAPGAKIEVAAAREHDEVHVSVTDDGPGVATGLATRVFGSGVTSGGGHGLGLAIARNIMESQDGRLWLDHEHTSGARFVLALPASGRSGRRDEADEVERLADEDGPAMAGLVYEGRQARRSIDGDGDVGI